MSKYIKLEDAINVIEDKIAEYIPTLYGRYAEIPLELRMAIEHLPTIEMIDTDTRDFCKRLHPTWDSGYAAGFNDGRKTERERIEVSEDCISREQFREQMHHRCFEVDNDPNMQKWDSGNWLRWKLFEEELENAPSVVPTVRENRTK